MFSTGDLEGSKPPVVHPSLDIQVELITEESPLALRTGNSVVLMSTIVFGLQESLWQPHQRQP